MMVFSFILYFNVNQVGANTAEDSSYGLGCLAGDNFNRTTGKPCSAKPVAPECKTGDLFSSITGKPCPTKIDDGNVCILRTNREFKIGSRGEDVEALQQELKDKGILTGKVDGIYGPITDGARKNYVKKCPIRDSNSVVISGVSGPQTLDVNKKGTWKVTAYNKNGGDLSYSVVWGDEAVYVSGSASTMSKAPVQQSATFTHAYSSAGTYTPTFTVTSENTIQCIATIMAPCPSNGGSATTSLTVKVGDYEPKIICDYPAPREGCTYIKGPEYNSATSCGMVLSCGDTTIKVLSPNGGEMLATGLTQKIKWKDNSSTFNIKDYEIKLFSYNTCTSSGTEVCAAWYSQERIIANGVSGSSYDWTIPDCDNTRPCSSDSYIPLGSYTIQVCETGTDRCDSSDNYFNIVKLTTN